MKKIVLLILGAVLLNGCIKSDSYEDIKIYTTVYPIEYIVNSLYGNYSEVESIYPSKIDINDYQITTKQIKDYSKGDMFIYNGLNNEKNIAASLLNENKKVAILDVSKGLEIKDNEVELWLSPTNFLMMTSNIKNGLKDLVTTSSILDNIDKNYNNLKISISGIDEELKNVAASASNKRIIVANNAFNFLSKYGFEVISIVDKESSNTNVSKAKSYFEGKQNTYLFKLSDDEETEDIKAMVSSGANIVDVPSMYTITEEQRKTNVTYIDLINDLIEDIKTEVY